MRWNKEAEVAIQILESQVRKVKIGKSEDFVKEFKFKDPRELALKERRALRGASDM